MKIIEIGTGYTSIPAQMGAATEIVVEELTRSLRKMGEDVSIVDVEDQNRAPTDLPIVESFMPRFLSTKSVVKLGIVHKLKRVLYSISLTRTLHRLIKSIPESEKIILHFHNQYNMFFFEKLTSSKIRKRVSIGYTVHSYIWFGDWESIKGTAKKKYFQEMYCCKHADCVYVLNSLVKKMMADNIGVNSEKVKQIINGVNIDTYNEKSAKQEIIERIESQYNLKDKKIILQVGSVCDRKNQLDSVKRLTPLMKQNKDIVFAYAGGIIDGLYQNAIIEYAKKEGIGNQVIYLGEIVPGPELNAFYTLSKIGIVNSKSEAFALVIAESLSISRPVFIGANLLDNLALWRDHEGKGILKITDNFLNDINHLLSDTSYYRQMQDKGRDLITSHFSWDVAAKQYLDSFRQM